MSVEHVCAIMLRWDCTMANTVYVHVAQTSEPSWGWRTSSAPRLHDGGAGDRSLPRMGRQRRHGRDALIRRVAFR